MYNREEFVSGQKCQHQMRHCLPCNETYGRDQQSTCPWHAYNMLDSDQSASTMPDSSVSSLSSTPYNYYDTRCDDECSYMYKKKLADMCRHGVVRCYSCGNAWDGFAQCPCYMASMSDNPESSDEDVFVPKVRPDLPDSTT